MKAIRTAVPVCFALLLVACGGGGGGGGGGSSSQSGLTMTLSPSTLTFASTNGETPLAQAVTASFSGTGSGTLYILVEPADPTLLSIGSISVTGMTSGEAPIQPAPAATVGAGSHTTSITVVACTNDPTCKSGQVNGSPQTINVTYNIDGVVASANTLSYAIGNAPTAANYVQTFSVTGYPVQNWAGTVSSDAPWLSLTPANGSTTAAVSVSATLDQAQITALRDGTYTGNVYVTPTNGNQISLPVTLTITRTQVDFVAPYVGTSGVSDSVIIRGQHFDLITQGAANFGATAASSFSVLSPTEIHATYPALAAGQYIVQLLSNGQAVGSSRANLVVVDPPDFPAATFSYPSDQTDSAGSLMDVTALIYDAERHALFAEVLYNNAQGDTPGPGTWTLARYVYSAGAWSMTSTLTQQQQIDFALTIDGTQLLTVDDDSDSSVGVTALDPSTLQAVAPVTTGSAGYAYTPHSIATANDGESIIPAAAGLTADHIPILAYSQLQPGYASLPSNTLLPDHGVAGASADGARVYIVSPFYNASNGFGTPPILYYDASSGVLTATSSAVQSATIAVDRHDTRVLLNAKDVYDTNFTLLASLPTTTIASTLAPDASRAYTYDSNGTVRVFDLTSTPVNSLYPEITPAKSLVGSPPPSTWGALAVSPDDGSLFVAISSGIFVVPLP